MSTAIGVNAQTVVVGQKTYTDAESYQRSREFLKVEELWSNAAPLYVLSKRVGNVKPVGDDVYDHLEEEELPQTLTTSGSHNSAATTIQLASGQAKNARKYMTLFNTLTQERMVITGEPDTVTDQVTVVRGSGAATIASGTRLQLMASSFPSGGNAPRGLDDTPKQKKNYLQIHKDAIEQDGRAIEQNSYGDTTGRNRNWKKMMSRTYQFIEKTLLFGELNDGTDGNPVTTGGLLDWITSNVIDASGGFTELLFNQFIEAAFRFNQGSDLLFICGQNLFAHMDSFGNDRIEYRPGDTVAGIAIGTYKCSFGQLKFIKHGMFNDSYDPDAALAGYGFAINLDQFKVATFKNRNMMIKKGAQTPDLDGIKDYVLHDFGCWCGVERKHAVITGIPNPFTA